jgi:hypothetical protein
MSSKMKSTYGKVIATIIVVFNPVLFVNTTFSQDIENFLHSVVYVSWVKENALGNDTLHDTFKNVPETEYGSGFLIGKKVDTLGTIKKYLITNKHLLPSEVDKENSISIRVYLAKRDSLRNVSIRIKDSKGNYLSNLKFGKNGDDIVAMDITDIWEKKKIASEYLDYKLITNTTDLTKWEFNAGDLMYILGFPSSLYHEKNSEPILRSGIIASNPKEPFYFNKKIQDSYRLPKYIDGFLIDASLFPGSSGSLVFYIPPKLPVKANTAYINIKGGRKENFRMNPFIIGLISRSIVDDESFMQRIDLGIVISYEVIKSTIDSFEY